MCNNGELVHSRIHIKKIREGGEGGGANLGFRDVQISAGGGDESSETFQRFLVRRTLQQSYHTLVHYRL